MRYSALQEIKKIKQGELCIDRNNQNPFRILCNDRDGMSAYYFSCPIYDERDHRLINLKFQKIGETYYGRGVNARIAVGKDHVALTNVICKLDFCLSPENTPTIQTEKDFWGRERECIADGTDRIFLTYNGVAIETKRDRISFRIDKGADRVMQNGHFVACMANEFLPYATVSPLAEKTSASEIVPLFCSAEIKGDVINVTFQKQPDSTILFAIDLYANKCVFDTTVESGHPDKNNAFGAIAVLGDFDACGTQWLYSRLDVMQFVDLNAMNVLNAKLYSFCCNDRESASNVYKMNENWCSFGSTWNGRIIPSEKLADTEIKNGYLAADITDIVKELVSLNMPRNPGIVMIPRQHEKNYRMISTGDNFFTPQIIEINLKKRG